MTEADIQRIEVALGITLSAEYRRVLTHYPFTTDSWADLAMPADADYLIEINQHNDYLADYGVATPEHYFCMGSDGGETRYYINWSRKQSPVFALDLELAAIVETAPTLDIWLMQLQAIDDEIKRDQQELAHKRW